MRDALLNRWWLLPIGVLVAASTITALSIVAETTEKTTEVKEEVVAEEAAASADCSGEQASDYACHQERYRDLALSSGVEAAFAELKDTYQKNAFVKTYCHQLTHVIGRAAAEAHGGDIQSAFSRGEHFCGTGYYHGVMETIVAKSGAEKMLKESDSICSELREDENRSDYHFGCAHGLGHGFMGVLENELFESLEACETLTNGWEREQCYGGVFMENVVSEKDPNHPSKYLVADEPLYPCTDVEDTYKKPCYRNQISYALKTQEGNFAKVFALCKEAEDDWRPACYRGLGAKAAQQSMSEYLTDEAQNKSTGVLCTLSEDHEAHSNCVIGAATSFLYHYRKDAQARALCDSLEASLGTICRKASEEYDEEEFDLDLVLE